MTRVNRSFRTACHAGNGGDTMRTSLGSPPSPRGDGTSPEGKASSMAVNRWFIAAGLAWLTLAPAARGQGVAFQPVVGAIPNGPTLGVTPAVSVDRRYVRLGINPQFIAVEGFNTFLVPAAVGGGPGGPGALGGVGLGGGGGGGAVGGGQFLAGMNGIISPM